MVLNKKFCVVCFSAKWCGPCKILKPVIETLSTSEEYKGIDFYKVDVDESQELSNSLKIVSLPTLIILNSGVEYIRIVGSNVQQIIADLNTLNTLK